MKEGPNDGDKRRLIAFLCDPLQPLHIHFKKKEEEEE